MRINRYIALCGASSRRKADELILSGKVELNGVTVNEPGIDINEKKDTLKVNGVLLKPSEEKVYYILNKPRDVLCACVSDHGEKTVVELVNDEHRLFPVGRLDKDSEGLIFLTNDGDFAYKLTHPKFEKSKKYLALLKGSVDDKDLKKLSKGVDLDGKKAAARKVVLKKQIRDNSLVEITLSEGRNRQIRRMCEIIGHPVINLKRTEEAGITLGELKSSEYRLLTHSEVKKCMQDERKPVKQTSKPLHSSKLKQK